ncbi:Uncharacterized protein conserved in bacteria [Anaerobiospirillum thomasii]|uniref:Ancillary SecYEG translocon subunit n=1 Tax=Anaerobiospirillum thomasii TaxID=179995 RepID=A0A2X0WGC6_9GAMM|nr:tetratricopeptide repeat protein [Anaerobiospirillum thomasii]SPT69427.1 Uncharacterized protein conserved in bacteria [Anaerobiospirillum thomasii]SPT72007.1 Uncharacterized protein conserved in bacteria [Anaerobiospirillum thomasii]
MDVLTDDHEREEAVKKWWKEYWKPIVLGIVIALGGLLGFRQYQAYELEKSQEAAYGVYQLQNQLNKDGKASLDKATAFMNEHKDIYGALLSVDVAMVHINAKEYDKAAEALNFARDNGGDLVSPLVTLMQAKLFAQTQKYDEALKALSTIKNKAYAIEKEEVSGDIYMLMGDKDKAHDAYKKALDLSVERKVAIAPLLQMKFDNIIKHGDTPAYKLIGQDTPK